MSEEQLFEQILGNLIEINRKLDRLLDQNAVDEEEASLLLNSLDVMTLLSLPDHLRETSTALLELDCATAEDVAKKTHKERAVESNYLNQLVRMGHVTKHRKGRKVYFCINERTSINS